MQRFDELTEREALALAVTSEEEDGRIYADFAESLRQTPPLSAAAKVMLGGALVLATGILIGSG